MNGLSGFATEGLDLLDVGVGIFDCDFKLVFANPAFCALRRYPEQICRNGVTLKALLRFNAERGDFGPGDAAAQVAERLAEIEQSDERKVEREMAGGEILGIRYQRTRSGGLVITLEDRTAERRAEAALKASEERYSLVSEAAEEAIYEWNIAEGRFFASPRLAALVDRDASEGGIRNWNWEEVVHPDDREVYQSTLAAHLSGEQPRWSCEYRLKDASGAWRWVSDHGTSIRDETGRAVRMVAAIRDISERVEKDAALAASEERHTLVSRATSDGIYDWNVADDLLYVSDRLNQLLDFDLGTKASGMWAERVHEEDYDGYVSAIRAHFKGETDAMECEYRVSGKGGEYRWLADHGIGVRDEDGRVIRLVGAVRDITDIKEAKAELGRIEARLMSSLATISDGILLVDAENRVQLWNDRYYEIFTEAAGGVDLSAVITKGRSFFDMIRDGYNLGMFKPHPDGVDAWVEARVKAWDQPVSEWELELANGNWILLNERQMPDGGRVSVYTDITEFKRREHEAQAARDRFEEAIESIASGFTLWDADDRLVIWNSRFAEYFSDLAKLFKPGIKYTELLAGAIAGGMFQGAEADPDGFAADLIEKRAAGIGEVRENRMHNGLYLQIRDHRTKEGGIVSVYTDVTELKTREEDSQAARQRFEEAIESIASGFALWDADDRLVVCNSRFREYFEDLADMVRPGTLFRDVLRAGIERGMFGDEGNPDAVLERILDVRAKASGTPRERHLTGGLWLQITDHRTKDGGIVSIYTDVTELKTSESEAQAARERFEEAIEAISTGFALFDTEDQLVLWNSRFQQYFSEMEDIFTPGVPFRDMLAATIKRGLFPGAKEDPEGFLEALLEKRAKGVGQIRENMLNDGLWLQIRDHRTKDGGMVSIYTDVTELKTSEQEAKAAQQRFEDAIEAISAGFSLWDAEDRLVTCNATYREFYSELADAVEPGVQIREVLQLAAQRGLLPAAQDDPDAYVEENIKKRAEGVGQLREHRLSNGRWLHITDHRTTDGGIVSIHTDVTELKNREEEVRAKSAILEATMENMGQGITMVDRDLNTVALNHKFLELMEFPEDQFKDGFSMEEGFRFNAERGEYGPGDIEEQVRERLELSRQFKAHRFERTRPDGMVMEIVGNPIEGGGFVSTYTDITERKLADEALKAALAEFNAVLDSIDYGVLFMGPDLRARIINRAFGELWNIPQEFIDQRPTMRELIEHNRNTGVYDVRPEDWDAWLDNRVEQIRQGDIPPGEFHRADGVVLSYQCVVLPDGGRMLTYFDITELKRAEQVSRDSEARLRGILENSPIGVAVIDDDNIIRFHNPRFPEVLRGPGEDLIGTSSTRFWTDLEERERSIERFRKTGRVANREVMYRGMDGSDVWSLSTYERTAWEGASARLIWLFDITEEKANRGALVVAKEAAEAALADLQKAQERLIQAEKMASLGQLTAGIAHEIKNPLNFVNNFAKLSDELLEELTEILEAPIKALDAETRDDAEDLFQTVRDNLTKINEHGRRADSIVKNMLLHSREGPSERQIVNLNAIADEALNLAYHGARAENPNFNIEMVKTLAEDVGDVECFPQDLMRVFLNLITNGMYAANKRGAQAGDGFSPLISITTRANSGNIEIEVRDNGMGIPAEVREKIFMPFFTTKPAGEGTGLGLSLSYDIVVKQHGGELSVDSEPGEFTAFRVTLPRSLPASGGNG